MALADGSPGSLDTSVTSREIYEAVVAYGAIGREQNTPRNVASLNFPDRVAPIAPAAEVRVAELPVRKLARVPSRLSFHPTFVYGKLAVPSRLSLHPTFVYVRSLYADKRISSCFLGRAKVR